MVTDSFIFLVLPQFPEAWGIEYLSPKKLRWNDTTDSSLMLLFWWRARLMALAI